MAKRSGASLARANKLIKKFNLIPQAVFDEAEKVITEQAGDIASGASAIAPVGEEHGGELAKKIKAKKTKKQKTRVRGTVASDAPHSIHIEYGTAEQYPQPYIRPTVRRGNRPQVMSKRILAAFKKG
jgi:HK97 gp10 family phage protein